MTMTFSLNMCNFVLEEMHTEDMLLILFHGKTFKNVISLRGF